MMKKIKVLKKIFGVCLASGLICGILADLLYPAEQTSFFDEPVIVIIGALSLLFAEIFAYWFLVAEKDLCVKENIKLTFENQDLIAKLDNLTKEANFEIKEAEEHEEN